MHTTIWLLLAPPGATPQDEHDGVDLTEQIERRISPVAPGTVTDRHVDVAVAVREVRLVGELDLSRSAVVIRYCVAGTEPVVVVDLSEVTFMDCGGYSAITAARFELHRRGRTLMVVGAVGEPARLLELLDLRCDTVRQAGARLT